MVGFIGALFLAGNLQAATEPTGPERIVNGTDAVACEFPAAVSMQRQGFHVCTGILIHPRVVMLAGHCVDGPQLQQARFGEDGYEPEFSVPIESCEAHPAYDDSGFLVGTDLAVCTLTADAPGVPIVPPIMGCEVDELAVGAEVVLAGYGFDDEAGFSGDGTKRWTTNTVEEVDEANNDLYLLGEANSSACFGDSGGPAYMQLSDGSWRVVGVTSQAHPDVPGPLVCGYGAVYDLVHLEMAWFEETTGYDLTPCFDPDGNWTPDENCGDLPTSLTTTGLSWGVTCVGTDVSGFSATCGEPFQPAGTTGGSDTGDSSSTGGDESTGGETTGDASSSSDGGDSTTTTSTTGPDPDPDPDPTTGTTGTTSDPMQSGDGGGCGCRVQDDPLPRGLAVSFLLLMGLRRRRIR